jgi:hypothetical protein
MALIVFFPLFFSSLLAKFTDPLLHALKYILLISSSKWLCGRPCYDYHHNLTGKNQKSCSLWWQRQPVSRLRIFIPAVCGFLFSLVKFIPTKGTHHSPLSRPLRHSLHFAQTSPKPSCRILMVKFNQWLYLMLLRKYNTNNLGNNS